MAPILPERRRSVKPDALLIGGAGVSAGIVKAA
jgi:hypothetical protein